MFVIGSLYCLLWLLLASLFVFPPQGFGGTFSHQITDGDCNQ